MTITMTKQGGTYTATRQLENDKKFSGFGDSPEEALGDLFYYYRNYDVAGFPKFEVLDEN